MNFPFFLGGGGGQMLKQLRYYLYYYFYCCLKSLLQYDYGFLGDKLFELASDKNIPPRNRKPLYTMVQR